MARKTTKNKQSGVKAFKVELEVIMFQENWVKAWDRAAKLFKPLADVVAVTEINDLWEEIEKPRKLRT